MTTPQAPSAPAPLTQGSLRCGGIAQRQKLLLIHLLSGGSETKKRSPYPFDTGSAVGKDRLWAKAHTFSTPMVTDSPLMSHSLTKPAGASAVRLTASTSVEMSAVWPRATAVTFSLPDRVTRM